MALDSETTHALTAVAALGSSALSLLTALVQVKRFRAQLRQWKGWVGRSIKSTARHVMHPLEAEPVVDQLDEVTNPGRGR